MNRQIKRCINKKCEHYEECSYGRRNERTEKIYAGDPDGMNRFGATPIKPVGAVCERWEE